MVWYLAAIAGTGLMATLGAFVRQISPGNEYAIALGRFGVGFACLALLRVQKPGLANTQTAVRARVTWPMVMAGVALALFVTSYFKAVNNGTLATAAFLLYLGPLIASSLAAFLLEEQQSRISSVLLGVALLGTLFITEFRLPDDPAQFRGVLFGVLAGLFYGLFLLFNNQRLQRDIEGFTGTSFQLLIAALVMLPVTTLTGFNVSATDLAWIIAIGVLHGFLALTLVITSLQHLKTIEYGTIAYGEPVAAAWIGVLAYQENISWLQFVGCFLVLAAGVARILMHESKAAKGEKTIHDEIGGARS